MNNAHTTSPTGRLPSPGPNLQNIPIRTTEGQRIRLAFACCPNRPRRTYDPQPLDALLSAILQHTDAVNDRDCNCHDPLVQEPAKS